MKLLTYFAIGCVALALAGMVAKIAILIVISLVLAAWITNPRDTAMTVLGFMLLAILAAHPGPGLIFLSVLIAFAAIQKARE